MEQTEEQQQKRKEENEPQAKPETTMRVYKRDAIILKQMQNTLGLHNNMKTQAEIMHEMLDFLFDHRNQFFLEIERQHRENQKMMEQWMTFMMKKMNNR
ncbi:MAG: hypothetical protein V1911_02785 [Candidatus Micrarchaeota archaeon]